MTAVMLNLNHFEPLSLVNGPGKRAVVWVQGCTLNCPGCFNPQTHPASAGKAWPVDRLVRTILKQQNEQQHEIEGISISGGEPLQQLKPLIEFARLVKDRSALSILLFSGFTWEEIHRIPEAPALLEHLDILIAGRYVAGQRLASGLIGSSNKTIHFLTNRYKMADLAPVPGAEVILNPDGEIVLSGIDPLRW
jgi:anaerobic ribonucleoside-triphosphate reductase activating protein